MSRLLTYAEDHEDYLKYLDYLWKRYKIRRTQWELQLKVQRNRCAICRRTGVRLLPDHNHKTGKFRGALCYYCNGILGKIAKHPRILTAIAKYLGRNW